jgi:hypothetical protein
MRRHLSPSVRAEIGLRRISVPPEVITLTARWYLRFGFSYHDVEELLAERGIGVDTHEPIPAGAAILFPVVDRRVVDSADRTSAKTLDGDSQLPRASLLSRSPTPYSAAPFG